MAKRKRRQLPVKELLGSDGALCVTFVNTARRQALKTYADLLAWGVEAGTLGGTDVERLERAAAEHPGLATGVERRVRTLRGRLERILLALAEGGKPAAADFDPFNTELRKALGARQLVATSSGYRWSWGEADEDLDRMLWPVLYSAGILLASRDRSRVRQCPGKGCGLFFVARGSGKPRKWCSDACLNRATTRKHYHAKIKPRRERIRREIQGEQRARLAGFDASWKPVDGKKS